jgi:hypothetical protein
MDFSVLADLWKASASADPRDSRYTVIYITFARLPYRRNLSLFTLKVSLQGSEHPEGYSGVENH